MRKSSLELAKKDIVSFFEDYTEGHGLIYKQRQLERFFSENRVRWQLAGSATAGKFIRFLLEETKFKKARFEFPSRTETRFIWGDLSSYELAMSLAPGSYFTHYTALYLHELTEQIPKTIYLNRELRPIIQQNTELAQDRIDLAFGRPARVSHNIAKYGDEKICILNGKHTGDLGITKSKGPRGEEVRVTDIERTLIDSMVRPAYSGGVFEVLKAYGLANKRVSVRKLIKMLQDMSFVYPYHQAMGFYMERAGVYKEASLKPLRTMEMKYDFYLTHGMKSTDYSKDWHLFFPKGF